MNPPEMKITFSNMEKSLTKYCKNKGLSHAVVKLAGDDKDKRYHIIENGKNIYDSQSAEAVAVWVDCLVITRRTHNDPTANQNQGVLQAVPR